MEGKTDEETRLLHFIRAELKRGNTAAEIKKSLSTTSWTEAQIEQLLKEAEQPSGDGPQVGQGSQVKMQLEPMLVIDESGVSKIESKIVEAPTQSQVEIKPVQAPKPSPMLNTVGSLSKPTKQAFNWDELFAALSTLQIIGFQKLSRLGFLGLLLFHLWRLGQKYSR